MWKERPCYHYIALSYKQRRLNRVNVWEWLCKKPCVYHSILFYVHVTILNSCPFKTVFKTEEWEEGEGEECKENYDDGGDNDDDEAEKDD